MQHYDAPAVVYAAKR